MKRMKLLVVAALALVICLPGMAGATNLVVNGGFETGDFTGWSATIAPDLPDPNSFLVYGGAAHSGSYGVFIGAYGPADSDILMQTVLPTVSGQSYTFDFWLNHTYGVTGTGNSFSAAWNGTTIFGLADAGAFGWTHYTFTETAAGISSIITFTGREVPGGWFLDDVGVNAVPIPPSALLMGSGLLGLVGLGWRRRKVS
jgi:hypothetical protein